MTAGLSTSCSSQGEHTARALVGHPVLVGHLALAAAWRWSKCWCLWESDAGSPKERVRMNPFLSAPPGSLSQGRNPLIHLMVFLWKEMLCPIIAEEVICSQEIHHRLSLQQQVVLTEVWHCVYRLWFIINIKLPFMTCFRWHKKKHSYLVMHPQGTYLNSYGLFRDSE